MKKFCGLFLVFMLASLVGYGVYNGYSQEPRQKPPEILPLKEHHKFSDNPWFGKHHKQPGCFLGINFTDEQREKLRKIYESYKKDIDSVESLLDDKAIALRNALMSGDEQNVRKAHKEMSQAKEDALVLRLRILSEIKAILSEEQKNKLDSCLKERFSKVPQRWQRDLFRFMEHP